MTTSVLVGPALAGTTTATAPTHNEASSAVVQTSDVLYRVNAGGPSVSAAPNWTADGSGSQYSSSGSTYTASTLSASDITNPTSAPSEVFLTERYGDHSWSFDVTSGTSYEVRLYFAEIYHGVSTPSADPGDREFDVSVEGNQVLDNYDIVAETGDAATATVETVEVTPSDGTVDVSLSTVTDNAKISAIEIVEAQPEPGVLGGPSSVNLGTTVVGETTTETITLSNEGDTGDTDITVSDVSVTGTDAGDFSTDFSGSTTLAPGETTDVTVTFAPSSADTDSATLEVSHDAPNSTSPLTVDLAGEGQSQTAVGFGVKDTVTSQVSNPTSLDFGPDGRLYVSERSGAIKVFEVTRTGEDAYDATLVETLNTVKNLPNHNDDGSYNSNVNQREVTGLTVAGTAAQPVLYVTSSDIRVGGGGSGTDTELDTNSGVVSRLTLQSDGTWDHDMVVRGLPRSEENHATNGVQYYTQNGNEYLLVAQGGHTNQGAPSNNFAYTPEYALSGAILEINLTKLDADNTLQDAANTDAQYLYDLPTLQGTATPFGGQDGENMAKLVQGDGVSIFSPGYRNPYDVERTEDGQVYTVDNGPNGGWGGVPVGEGTDPVCTNEPNEQGTESNSDNLHYVTEGFYGGHPNPTRANPDNAGIWEDTAPENNPQQIGSTADAVYDGYDGSQQCDYRPAGEGDGALWTNGASTNGMDEYTASNFEGGMQGDLLTAAFDGNVYRIQLTSDGTDISTEPTAQFSPGNTPLDVDAVGDDGPFPGTVFVAEFGGAISAYEPNDYNGSSSGDTCTGADDASLDEDGDGYDNADEIDAGSDPCSASSTPPDYDGDGTSDVNDPDDDNDGIDDVADPFAVDADNGLSTTVPVRYDFVRASVPDSLEGIGFTGLMIPDDGSTDYQDLYVQGDTVFGGANPALTIEAVKPGDATNNDQQHAYQFGIDPPAEPFVVDTTVTGFTDDPDQYEAAGIFIGTGDQDNYRKLTVNGFGGGTSGQYGVQLFGETAGTNNGTANLNVNDSFTGPGTTTRLELVVDPTTDPNPGNSVAEVNVTGYYTIDDGQRTAVGSTAVPAAWLDTSDGTGLAVGVIATSYQGDVFSVTYNDLNVTTVADDGSNNPPTADAGADQTVEEGSQVTLDATGSTDPDGDQLGYTWTQLAGPDVSFDVQDSATPSFTAPAVDSETTLTFEVSVSDGEATDTDTVSVTVQDTNSAGDLTIAEAIADNSAPEDQIDLQEIQTAIDYWSTGSEVPDTGGKTISLTQIQELIDIWSNSETVGGGSGNTAPTVDAIADQTVTEGETAQVSVSASDADGDSLTLSKASGPSFVTLTDNGDGTGSLGIAPSSGDAGTYTVEVEAADGNGGTATESFQLTVETASTDDVVFAANAGGSQYTASDGTVYQASSNTNAFAGGKSFSASSDIANTDDDPLYQTELYGGGSGSNAPAAPNVSVPVQDGTYEVTLKFAELFQGSEDARVFDVYVEGDQKLNDYDIYAEVGNFTATDKTYTVEVTDGELNVNFTAEVDNAKLGAIKVVRVGDATQTTSADVSVNSDSSNIDASTYSGGSFEVKNTGDTDIESVRFDLSESIIPDAVFDPVGTAGDATSKGVVIDSESGDGAGVVSTANADVFSEPHNGVDNEEGYDVLTLEFTDFNPGETVTFSTDIDPTTIKGASTTGGAGSVSGLELSGSSVTVQSSADAVANDLYTDGSNGGAQATVSPTTGSTSAPALGVDGVTLQSTDFPAHEAATVSTTSQTLTLSGPAGATVRLLTIEASEPPSDGYDVDAFEADNAEAVSTQTVTLDSNGEATVDVSLSESNLNYFQAAVQDGSGATGAVSQTVVLEVQTNTAPSIDPLADQTVVTGENVVVPVSASDPDGDSVSLSLSQSPDFVTLNSSTSEISINPASGDAGTYTVEVTADDGSATTTESFQLTVDTATATTSGTALARVNAGGSTLTATDGGLNWTGVTDTGSQFLASASGGNYGGGDGVSAGSEVPSSTPTAVYDAERYGEMTWEFNVSSGAEVEVRLYLSNQFPEATEEGDRQYNVGIEGDQVLTQYDPVQDVGHATGTVKAFTVTEDGDGTVTITFTPGAAENPQVNAIEIVETSDSSSS